MRENLREFEDLDNRSLEFQLSLAHKLIFRRWSSRVAMEWSPALFVECPVCHKKILKLLFSAHEKRHQIENDSDIPTPEETETVADTLEELQIKKGITLSFAAGKAIREIMDRDEYAGHSVVRVSVNKNLTTGYHYDLSIEDQVLNSDAQYLSERVKIVVDRSLVEFLRGTVIDFESRGGQSGFRFLNPNDVKPD